MTFTLLRPPERVDYAMDELEVLLMLVGAYEGARVRPLPLSDLIRAVCEPEASAVESAIGPEGSLRATAAGRLYDDPEDALDDLESLVALGYIRRSANDLKTTTAGRILAHSLRPRPTHEPLYDALMIPRPSKA